MNGWLVILGKVVGTILADGLVAVGAYNEFGYLLEDTKEYPDTVDVGDCNLQTNKMLHFLC